VILFRCFIDTICKRPVSFMKNCLNSRSDVVSYAAKFGVYFVRQSVPTLAIHICLRASVCTKMTKQDHGTINAVQ